MEGNWNADHALAWATSRRSPWERDRALILPSFVDFARGNLAAMESKMTALSDQGLRWFKIGRAHV